MFFIELDTKLTNSQTPFIFSHEERMDFIDDHGFKMISYTQEEAVQKVVEGLDRVIGNGDVGAFDAEADLLALNDAGIPRFRNYATLDFIFMKLTQKNLDILFSFGIDSFPDAVFTIGSIGIWNLRAVVEWGREVLEAIKVAWLCVKGQLFT